MDDFHFKGEVVDHTLRELGIINKWLGGDKITIEALDELVKNNPSQKIFSIADIGCGGGDTLKVLSDYGRKKGLTFKLVGVDANAYIVDYAKNNTLLYGDISYVVEDVLSEDFKQQQFDVIICSLFCHHFNSILLIQLLSQLKRQAKLGVVINDLHRHWLAYYSIIILSRLFSKSYMLMNDSKLSVLRAFRKKELQDILSEAGYTRFSIKWNWAFRFKVIALS